MDREISREEYEALFAPGREYIHPTVLGDIARERDDQVSLEVANARRSAAQQAIQAFMLQRRDPYQLNLPGVNPELMALRYQGGLTPQEEAAAGVIGRGWQQSADLSRVEQLMLDLERQGVPENNIREIVRQAAVEEISGTDAPRGPSGRRMAMRYGLPALAALGSVYAIAALSQPGAEVEQESYAGARR